MPSIKYSLPKNQLRRLTTFKARQESAPSSVTDPGACEILVDPQAGNFDPSSCTYNAFHFGNWTDTASTPTSGTRDTTSQYPYRVYLKLFGGLGTYDHGTGHGFSGTGEYPPLLTANNGYMHTGASYSGSIPLYRSSHQLEYINDVVDVQVATQKIKRTVRYQGSTVYENTISLPVHLRYVQLMGDSKFPTDPLSCRRMCVLRFEYGTPSYSGDIDSNGNRDASYANPLAGQPFPQDLEDWWLDQGVSSSSIPANWYNDIYVDIGGTDLFEDNVSARGIVTNPVWAVNEWPFDRDGDYWVLKNQTFYSPQAHWNTVHQYAESNTSNQCVFNAQGAVGGRFAAAPESPTAAFYLKQYALLNSNYSGTNWPSYWDDTTGSGLPDLQTIGMFQDLHWVSELNLNPTYAELEAESQARGFSTEMIPGGLTSTQEAITNCVHHATSTHNVTRAGTLYSSFGFGVRRPFVLVPGGVYTNSSDWMPHWRNKDSASTQTGTVNMIGVGIEIEETA
jgi:hypothetical protein